MRGPSKRKLAEREWWLGHQMYLARLTERTRVVIEAYYGLNGQADRRLIDAGQIIGVSYERARQLVYLTQANYGEEPPLQALPNQGSVCVLDPDLPIEDLGLEQDALRIHTLLHRAGIHTMNACFARQKKVCAVSETLPTALSITFDQHWPRRVYGSAERLRRGELRGR